MVPQHKVVGAPEQSEIGLLGGAGAIRVGAQGLDLVVRGRVPLARERRRWSGEIGRGWAPLAESGAASEGWWVQRKAPVICPQSSDTRRCLLAHGYSGVVLGQAMGGQIVVIGRVEGRGLGREAVDEHIVR